MILAVDTERLAATAEKLWPTVFTARCTLVKRAVSRLHVVRPSVWSLSLLSQY